MKETFIYIYANNKTVNTSHEISSVYQTFLFRDTSKIKRTFQECAGRRFLSELGWARQKKFTILRVYPWKHISVQPSVSAKCKGKYFSEYTVINLDV